ncbi:hypothetical protein G7054_g7014 [Neopestalotiopsis clavispora]|nr:hypothetical protein G7054_g7014 [Neopestalotiopsis clavispora]
MAEDGDTSARLQAFFRHSSRYVINGMLGEGGNGQIYRIIGPNNDKFLLKVSPDDPGFADPPTDTFDDSMASISTDASLDDTVVQLIKEKMWLDRMRHCRHIINTIDVPDDPLAAQRPGAIHTMHAWLYMEFAENGTLRDMMDKALDTNGDLRHLQPNQLAHCDFSDCNAVFGDMDVRFQHPEHSITPFIKLIDFGEAREIDAAEQAKQRQRFGAAYQAEEMNVFGIGELMMGLITFESSYDLSPQFPWSEFVEVEVGGEKFKSASNPVWGRRDELIRDSWIDPDILNQLYRCMAEDGKKRPRLLDLAIYVRDCVSQRDQAYYRGHEHESDDAIRQLMVGLLANPGN